MTNDERDFNSGNLFIYRYAEVCDDLDGLFINGLYVDKVHSDYLMVERLVSPK